MASSAAPWGLRWRSSTFFIVFVVGVGIFTDLVTYSIVVPVLPFVLRDRVGVPDHRLQIYVSVLIGVMAAASFVFSPVAGVIADRTGNRQRPFLAGLFALLFSTILLATGETVGLIALARVLQGMSSAVVWVVGLAICLETVGPNRLGTTIGTIFSFVNLGTQAAPVLGGVLYSKTGYASVFALCLGLVCIDIVLRLLMIEKKTAARYRAELPDHACPSPVDGQVEEQTPLLEDSTAQPDLEAYRLPAPSNWLTRKNPIFLMLGNSALITSFYIGFVQAFLIGSYDSTIPLIALEYYNFDSLKTGILFLALGLPGMVSGPLAGWAVDKYSPRIVAILGYGYLVPMHILFRVPRPGGPVQVAIFAVILALSSIGNAAIDSPSMVEAGIIVEKYHKANPALFGDVGPYAQLYGMNSMVFSLGVTVGPVVAGALKDTIGYGNMNAVMAAVCGSAAILSWRYLGTEPSLISSKGGDEIDGVDCD
ncbi:uncharacterized protein PV09_08761 [Verruconis gallopava]|uniref:Major facilitator superfamily (MFS) profile domain-containing protein n=1 Tax=Verruconis gallopava TaxID=253628 RepID=A0A0D1ZZX6_9PEZI|nr:uncharacterized protein PV09_08761 [Verruconis gallopava]KIV99584.1 hypothetical protein PV09_08761 [Verruconis gallopava]